jgi:hypothetical protein
MSARIVIPLISTLRVMFLIFVGAIVFCHVSMIIFIRVHLLTAFDNRQRPRNSVCTASVDKFDLLRGVERRLRILPRYAYLPQNIWTRTAFSLSCSLHYLSTAQFRAESHASYCRSLCSSCGNEPTCRIQGGQIRLS